MRKTHYSCKGCKFNTVKNGCRYCNKKCEFINYELMRFYGCDYYVTGYEQLKLNFDDEKQTV